MVDPVVHLGAMHTPIPGVAPDPVSAIPVGRGANDPVVRRLRSTASEGPVGLGYVRLPVGAPHGASLIRDLVAEMSAFAQRCGYQLGDVFVDDDATDRPAWEELVNTVRSIRPVAVLVPDLPEFRTSESERRSLLARLRRVTNAPLVMARHTAPIAALPQPTRRGAAATTV